MQIIKEKEQLKELIRHQKKEGRIIGFVPTMGALHPGHLSLAKTALENCDEVVISIFVNPTQFENPEDLQKYPRNLEKDIELLSEISPDFIIFTPAASEIYGETVISESFSFDGIENQMEGKYRTGHFDGVGTVVKKLFEIVEPDKAFFGEKDFQQLQIVRKLVEKLKLKIAIFGCPIDREISGLARSSRNERLSPEQREKAASIYQILQKVKESFGTKSAIELIEWANSRFAENPDLKLEYFEIADAENLQTATSWENGKKYRAFVAAYSGEIRLIDNIALN